MDARPAAHRIRRILVARPVLGAVAALVGLPLLALFAAALHFWSTAASFADYQPAAPSRLYAAPRELQPGASLSGATLAEGLERLGYRRSRSSVSAGQYTREGGRFRIGLRPGDGEAEGLPP